MSALRPVLAGVPASSHARRLDRHHPPSWEARGVAGATDSTDALTLLDWRRQVFAMYADIRNCNDPAAAHATWRERRDALFASHPQSPLSREGRATFAGLPVAPYDRTLRFDCPLVAAPPAHLD